MTHNSNTCYSARNKADMTNNIVRRIVDEQLGDYIDLTGLTSNEITM